jgi:osmotically-inducible protein OsmY
MLKRAPVPDHILNQKVVQQLSNRGVRPPCKVVVSTHKGSITLSGQIQYEHQRHAAVQAAQHVEGVQRVVDQLQVIPKTLHKQQAGLTAPSR